MMLRLLRQLGEYWYYTAATVGASLLLGLYLSSYYSSLRPRPGTLEWIERYDHPAFSLAGQWRPLARRDAAFLIPACLAALAVWGFAAWSSYRDAGAPLWGGRLYAAIRYGLVPMGIAASVYCLIRCLFGCAPAALLGALVLSLDLTADPEAQLAAALLLLLLARFFTAEAERSFAASAAPLALCAAELAAACYLMPALWPLAAGGLVLVLAGCAARFVELGKGRLWQSLLVFVPVFLAVYFLIHIPAALLDGMAFPQAPFSADYCRRIAAGLAGSFRGMIAFRTGWALTVLCYDWPMVAMGLGATLALLLLLRRRRDFRIGMLGLFFGILALLWLFCGPYALPLACVLSLGCLWSDLWARRSYVLFALGPGLLLALLGSFYVSLWIV